MRDEPWLLSLSVRDETCELSLEDCCYIRAIRPTCLVNRLFSSSSFPDGLIIQRKESLYSLVALVIYEWLAG